MRERITVHAVPETGQCWLGCQCFLIKDCSHHRIVCQFICTVVFEIRRYDLINQLHQVIRIFMNTALGVIVGLEKPYQTNTGGEFFNEKQASIGRKIAAVEINFDFLIAFK